MITFFRRVLAEKAGQFYLVATLTVVVPLVALIVMGFTFLWMQDWLLWFSVGLLILSLITLLLRYLLWCDLAEERNQQEQALEVGASPHLPAIPDWSSYDTQVWEKSLENITRLELAGIEWSDVPYAMRDQLTFVARTYHQDAADAEYAFTVPEMLLMLEVCSREYRALVLENVPFSQGIKVSTVMGISQKTTMGYKAYKRVAPIVDIARAVLTGGSSVPGRVVSEMMVQLGKGLTEHMKENLKQLLFEQVSQVAINLYSGRLKLSDAEMSLYRKSIESPEQAEMKPLSVMVVGQVNAGKSSLVNALLKQSVAEVDVLPATAGFHHYQLSLAEGLEINLMDTPGLDGSQNVSSTLLEQTVKADLLLLVSQANQPAKALDKEFMDEWNHYFDQHLGRKKPPVLLVTTHNDMLKPQQSWQPPYDLADTSDKKVRSIVNASSYTREKLGLGDHAYVVPIAMKPGEAAYNLVTLRDILVELNSEARAAQLNRERLNAADSMAFVSKALSQTAELAQSGVKLIFR